MKGLWTQTRREKLGAIDGLNLFFGALLGANLGTLDAMPIGDYAKLIILLAFTVASIRVAATSERRLYAFANLLLYALLLGAIYLTPKLHPTGMTGADLQRLIATLAVWIGAALIFELYPIRPDEPAPTNEEG